ncbi:hypothetical protein FNV43_RR05596 [Rhamnella rubrinervis]|uniref:Uncharacterized protein n=1 Tax=Rhamnella rubrinervis TaxID=2594499 RepID=A0A8K0HN92_9ROSA|nr:hypothetical protein FNV43_RR05596 [Rhamnella rubrinervis]
MSNQDHIFDQQNLPKIQPILGDDKEDGQPLKLLLDEQREADHDHQEHCCRTPTSSDHKIPSIQSCPPTPRKPRGGLFSQKRKLTDLHFFETTGREEVESFFRSNLLDFPRAKKRCRSI